MENKELLKQALEFGRKLRNTLKEKETISLYLNIKDFSKTEDVHHFVLYIGEMAYDYNFELPDVVVNILTYDKVLQSDIMYCIMLGLKSEAVVDKEIESSKNNKNRKNAYTC